MIQHKILIIDDDAIGSKIVAKQLNRVGHLAIIESDGRKWRNYVETENISVILLDIIMPNISGIDVLKEIRTNYSKVQIPVIMATAVEQKETIVQALNNGANDYVNRPINIPVLLARIQTQVDMVALYQKSLMKTKLETVNSMIVTYNHEINNPLSIAMSYLRRGIKTSDPEALSKAYESLCRIAKIVKKIGGITASIRQDRLEEQEYATGQNMISLDDKDEAA